MSSVTRSFSGSVRNGRLLDTGWRAPLSLEQDAGEFGTRADLRELGLGLRVGERQLHLGEDSEPVQRGGSIAEHRVHSRQAVDDVGAPVQQFQQEVEMLAAAGVVLGNAGLVRSGGLHGVLLDPRRFVSPRREGAYRQQAKYSGIHVMPTAWTGYLPKVMPPFSPGGRQEMTAPFGHGSGSAHCVC